LYQSPSLFSIRKKKFEYEKKCEEEEGKKWVSEAVLSKDKISNNE
jgi:hypothetical protein